MRAYWHIPAIAAVAAILVNMFQVRWLIVAFFVWLYYLFYWKRLGNLPTIVSAASFIFFLFYIPSPAMEQSAGMVSGKFVQNAYTGKIITPVTVTTKKIEFVMEEQQTKEKILIVHFPKNEQLELDIQPLNHGATCMVHGELEIPPESRNPGQFDYRNYLMQRGVTYQVILDTSDQIRCIGTSYLQPIYDLRMSILTFVKKRLSEDTAAWLNALVLGDDSNMDEETIHLFQRWGLSHILAISGLHVGIVLGIVYFILVKCNLLTKEKAQVFLIGFLPIFTLLAGGEPSVVRATFMAFLFLIINTFKIKMNPADVLSIVFLILITWDRHIVYHVGFQFSFIVTLALILSRKMIAKEKSIFVQGLQISFISQMMILPLQFNYFSTFQPLSILLNTIVVPCFSVFVIPFMFFLLFLSPFSFILDHVDSFFVWIHSKILFLIEGIDQLLYFPWIIGSFSMEFTVMYYVLFFLFMHQLENNEKRRTFEYGIMLTLLIMAVSLKSFLSPYGTVTMLDIGQGDAFVIELPYQKGVIMIDAGAAFSFEDMEPTDRNYEQIIKPYLYSRGIHQIDALIVTHDDLDHMGSVPFIVQEMNVKKIVVSNYFQFSDELSNAIHEHNVQVEVVERGDQLQVADQLLYVLGPYSDQQSSNDNSIILYAKIGGKYWLFTGDISKEQEREIIQTYPELEVDVLKIAHHGSDTSTDEQFIQHTHPDIGLISVGNNNAYGHPSDEVVELLAASGTTVLRTDLHGAVQYRFTQEKGTFYSYLP